MVTNRSAPEQEDAKQYLVKCEGCSFERAADGRALVTQIGNDHHQETGHEVIAVEVPPSGAFS